jgi:hypothetical protein
MLPLELLASSRHWQVLYEGISCNLRVVLTGKLSSRNFKFSLRLFRCCGSPRSGQKKKKKAPCAYPPVLFEPTPHSFVFIYPAPKERGCSSVRPLLQHALIELPRRFLSSSPAATRTLAPCVARCGRSSVRPLPQRTLVGLPRRALFPHCRPHHAPSLPTPLTCMAVTCIARSLAVRLSPIAVGPATDPAMAAGAHVPWRLRSSPGEPRAPTSVDGAGGARAPRLIVGSHLDGRNRLARPSLHYVAYVCFKYFKRFICMLQLFYLDVAKVDRVMLQVF